VDPIGLQPPTYKLKKVFIPTYQKIYNERKERIEMDVSIPLSNK
jgi:hypothetical protein